MKRILILLFSVLFLTGTAWGTYPTKTSVLPFEPAVFVQETMKYDYIFVSQKIKPNKRYLGKMWLGLTLNMVFGFGLGSFAQGDKTGGWIGVIGDTWGWAFIRNGYIETPDSGSKILIGFAILYVFRIFQFFRPIWYYQVSALLDARQKTSLFILPKTYRDETANVSIDGVRAGLAFRF